MRHLQLFEAFAGKSISSIDSFLKKIDIDSRGSFLSILINIASINNIPLSNFKGDYMSAKKAISINSDTDDIIKMWFSLDDGYITFTVNNKEREYKLDDLKDEDIEFVKNNLICYRDMTKSPWNYNSYNGIYQSIKSAEYALVINLSKLDKGLNDIKKSRVKNKPLPRINNEFYRRENRKRWNDKMSDNGSMDELYDIIEHLQKSHKNHRLVDMMLDAYNRGDINKKSLFVALSSLTY